MAHKRLVDLRAAAQALAPVTPKPPEPVQSYAEREASRKRIGAMIQATRARMKASPRAAPLERWHSILNDPYACFRAKELAQEAIADAEGKLAEVERIAIEAEMQETARRIAKQLGEKEHERAGDTA